MDQIDLFSLSIQEDIAAPSEDGEMLLVKLRTNETRHRSIVKIGEGIFYKEVLRKPSFPKDHWLYTDDYYGEVCKECLKTGFISELNLDKRWKRCRVHGWMNKGAHNESKADTNTTGSC